MGDPCPPSSNQPARGLRRPGPGRGRRLGIANLTVADCLALTPLNQGTVVSGTNGLGRPVSWVHVVDHSDPEESLSEGELLLTSGIALSQDLALRRDIFDIMERQRSAGLVIAIGRYLPDVPRDMAAEAEARGIPLISLPWEVNFGDITRAVLTPLVHAHYRFLEHAEELNRDMLDLLARRADPAEICDRAAAAVERAVAIVDGSGSLRAFSAEAREALGGERREPLAAMLAALDRSGGGRLLVHSKRLLGTAFPLPGHDRLWLVVDGAGGPLPRGSLLIAASAAATAAIALRQEDASASAAERAERLLTDALNGTAALSPAAAKLLGLDARQPVALAAIEPRATRAADLLGAARAALGGFFGARIGTVHDGAAVFVLQRALTQSRGWADRFAVRMRDAGHPCRIALGRPGRTAADLAEEYAAVREALALGGLLRPAAEVLPAEQSAMLARLVRQVAPGSDPRDVSPAILRLEEQDRSLHGSLVATLDAFLEADGNVSAAARGLAIHRHTLLYRLERIQDILDTPLDAPARLELRLQLVARRLARRNAAPAGSDKPSRE